MTAPPFVPRTEGAWEAGADYLTQSGAGRLRAMICAAWARVGVDIDVPIRNVGRPSFPIWSPDLSALPGGLPR